MLKHFIIIAALFSCPLYGFDLLNSLRGGAHYVGKWYSQDYRITHVTSPESKKLCDNLKRIALEGSAERALDDKTGEELERFNERSYLLGMSVIEALKKSNNKEIKKIYEESPPELLNIVVQLFMLKSLVHEKMRLAEDQRSLDNVILKDKTATKTPVQVAEEIKRTLLDRLMRDREKQASDLLTEYVTNTMTPSTPALTTLTTLTTAVPMTIINDPAQVALLTRLTSLTPLSLSPTKLPPTPAPSRAASPKNQRSGSTPALLAATPSQSTRLVTSDTAVNPLQHYQEWIAATTVQPSASAEQKVESQTPPLESMSTLLGTQNPTPNPEAICTCGKTQKKYKNCCGKI